MNYLKPFALLMGIFVFANAAIEISDAQVTVTDRFIMVEIGLSGWLLETGIGTADEWHLKHASSGASVSYVHLD